MKADAVYDALEAGQFSVHDVHLVHGSAANTSGKRRAAITLRYMPATAHWDREIMAVPTPGQPLAFGGLCHPAHRSGSGAEPKPKKHEHPRHVQ